MNENLVVFLDEEKIKTASKALIDNAGLSEVSDISSTLLDILDKSEISKFVLDDSDKGRWLKSILLAISLGKEDTEISKDKENPVDVPIPLPSVSTRLDEAILPEGIIKLFTRLKNISMNSSSFEVGDTISDVLALTVSDLDLLHGVGKLYKESLLELKALYKLHEDDWSEEDFNGELIDLNDFFICYSTLNDKQVKVMEKLERNDHVNDISSFLDIDPNYLLTVAGFGSVFINELLKLKRIVKDEVSRHLSGEIDFYKWQSKLLVPIQSNTLTLGKLEEMLLEDIDDFLDGISEDESDILQKRWGFVERKTTLEQLGEEYQLTRERIRQIEKKITKKLFRNLRIKKDVIWDVLEPSLSFNISDKLKDFNSCFNDIKDFYEVLGILSGYEKIEEYINPIIKPYILNSYFVEHGGPISYEDAYEFLEECELDDVKDIGNALKYLESEGRIYIDRNNIWPRLLKKQEASAFILANHPGGLPWKDIAKLINDGNYSRSTFSVDRIESSTFDMENKVYLSGKGVYKHTRFIDFESIDIDKIFEEILKYYDTKKYELFHLSECYRSSVYLMKQNYYVIRHIVKNIGEDYGFYFNGRSQVDSISLEKSGIHLTQKDVILRAMNDSHKPFTKKQIAALLKSNSIDHAGYYLDQLMHDDLVVQVERMLYTTPEKAFKNINMAEYVEALNVIFLKEARPVDSSIFEGVLNSKFSSSFSKFFYASIARVSLHEHGWYRSMGLYASSPIEYSSLLDAITSICDQDRSLEDNITLLRDHIAITKNSAAEALSRWRREIKLGNID